MGSRTRTIAARNLLETTPRIMVAMRLYSVRHLRMGPPFTGSGVRGDVLGSSTSSLKTNPIVGMNGMSSHVSSLVQCHGVLVAAGASGEARPPCLGCGHACFGSYLA